MHGTSIPGRRRITLAFIIYQRETLSFRVFEGESQSSIVLHDLVVPHVPFIKMA
jgi:hypothetical protein